MEQIRLHLGDVIGGPTLTDGNRAMVQNSAVDHCRHLSMQSCHQLLVHAAQCSVANCPLRLCYKLKFLMVHTRSCQRTISGGCPLCKKMVDLCIYHVPQCHKSQCSVPFCAVTKQKLLLQQLVSARLSVASSLRFLLFTISLLFSFKVFFSCLVLWQFLELPN